MNNTSLPPRPIVPIVVPVEDEPTHVAPWWLCQVPTCPCHNDPELVGALLREFDRGKLNGSEVLRAYWHMPQEQTNEQQPYLGQRCHVEGKGFGTIVDIGDTLGKEHLAVRVELDAGVSHWYSIDTIELLETYPAG
jgi:hypothetical protein